MSDNELEEYLKTIEPNFDSHIEKGTIEMSNEYYNLLEERMIRLLNENKQLKEENARLKEWKEDLLNENIELENIRKETIEYIESIKIVNCKRFDYNTFHKYHLISQEELEKRVKEDGTLEGHFIEVNKDKLLEILGDKENE